MLFQKNSRYPIAAVHFSRTNKFDSTSLDPSCSIHISLLINLSLNFKLKTSSLMCNGEITIGNQYIFMSKAKMMMHFARGIPGMFDDSRKNSREFKKFVIFIYF